MAKVQPDLFDFSRWTRRTCKACHVNRRETLSRTIVFSL